MTPTHTSTRPYPVHPAGPDTAAGGMDPHPAAPPSGLVSWLLAHAPLLGATGGLLVAAVTAAAALGIWTRRTRARAARRAVWLAISPPAVLPPNAPLALWQALEGILRRANRRARWPRVALAVEFVAEPGRVRAGIWVPPAIPARSVARAVARAWPGARVTRQGPGPVWLAALTLPGPFRPAGQRPDTQAAVAELAPPDRWAPLIDPAAPRAAPRPAGPDSDERLRAVLAGLARRAPGERACAQLVVTTNAAWNGATSPRRWCARAVTTLAAGSLCLLAEILEIAAPTRARHPAPTATPSRRAPTPAAGADPAATAAQRGRETKRACGPHLHATLRVAVHRPVTPTDPTHRRRIRRRLVADVADIAAGYDLVTTALRARHSRRAEPVGTRRPGAGFAASLPELAALWHLPGEPTSHHMAAARARTHRHTHTIDHLPHPPRTGHHSRENDHTIRHPTSPRLAASGHGSDQPPRPCVHRPHHTNPGRTRGRRPQ